MLESSDLRKLIIEEIVSTTSYPLLLDVYYRILKEHGISYITIRSAYMKQRQLSFWDRIVCPRIKKGLG